MSMCRDSFTYQTWLISCMRHDSFVTYMDKYVPCLQQMRDITLVVLQCVAVCCSVLQCVADARHDSFTIWANRLCTHEYVLYIWVCNSVALKVSFNLNLQFRTHEYVPLCVHMSSCANQWYNWVYATTYLHVRHDWVTCGTWLTYIWDMTHPHVRHESFPFETWLIDMLDVTHWHVRHDSLTYESCLIDMWDMTHWHVRHDSLTCETWLIDMWDMTHPHVRHDSLTYESCRIDVWDTTHRHVRHGSFTHATWLIYI